MNSSINMTTPWYRQFWPWFLISFPLIAVIAGIATVVIAVKTDDGLVNDDYYKTGLAINKVLDREVEARRLNLKAGIDWQQDSGLITLRLQGKLQQYPQRLKLMLSHATRAHLDQNVLLLLSPDGKSYTARIKNIKDGNWNLVLQPENLQWRIDGRASIPQETNWSLRAE